MFGSHQWKVPALILTMLAASGCDGRVLFAGNIAVAAVPCVLLWVTVNLKKSR